MGLWDRLAGLMLHLIDEYDDQALFVWLFIEETGFPLPLPGDLAMLLAGTRVAQGKMNLIWALFLLEVATLLGGSALYWLGARCCTATAGMSAWTAPSSTAPRRGSGGGSSSPWRSAGSPRACGT